MSYKTLTNIFTFSWVILCIAGTFTYSQSFTDPYIIPKWLAVISIALSLGVCYSIRFLLGRLVPLDLRTLGISMLILCSVQAVCGLLQFFSLPPSQSVYKVTGTFDNPAGFASCLCCCLPFIVFMILHCNKHVRYISWIAGGLTVTAVFVSYSRSGIISIITICVIFLCKTLIHKKLLKYFLPVFVVGLLIIVGYSIKKDSADGRLLIWKCGLEMVKDAPWLGHGIGSFEAHYMDYQADYFRHQGLQNRYAMLADNVKQPFNEYLGILINWGIVGFLLLSGIISILIYCYKQNPTLEKKVAFYCLISIAIFSCFSYPFTYPFTWIVLFLAVIILIGEYLKQIKITKRNRTIISILVMICSFIGIIKVTERIRIERDWYKTSVFGLCHSYDKALPLYANLEYKFDNNPYFLYNYAAVLSEDKHYEESLKIALKCRQYWADYDLELMIGENYQNLDNLELAEKYYNNAAMMCPSRFLPLYKLFHLYKENNNHNQAQKLAEIIINKPMKIKTPTILMMKREMKREIATLNEFTKKL